jgi:hypothetical protein
MPTPVRANSQLVFCTQEIRLEFVRNLEKRSARSAQRQRQREREYTRRRNFTGKGRERQEG